MWLVIFRYAEELNIQIDQHAEAWARDGDPHRTCCESYADASGSRKEVQLRLLTVACRESRCLICLGHVVDTLGRIGDYELCWTTAMQVFLNMLEYKAGDLEREPCDKTWHLGMA